MPGPGKVIHLLDPHRGTEPRVAPPVPAGQEQETSEATLIRRLCAGDRWAERALIDRYAAHVERILMRILGGHPDLDDLTQEVFVRAFERLDELHDPPALPRWLGAIAVFVAREAIRRKKRRQWLIFLPAEK